MRPAAGILVAGLSALPALTYGGVLEVQIRLPAPQKIDTTGMNRLMVGGFRTHLRRNEYARSLSNVFLFVVAVLVAVGRFA